MDGREDAYERTGKRKRPPVPEIEGEFQRQVVLCGSCHFAYDHGKAQLDGGAWQAISPPQMLKRFEQVQQRVGRDLLRRFQDATSTVTWRRGAYLRIYYQLLENWKVTIDQIYQELPAVVPITFAEASKNQHMALKRVAQESGCRVQCANPACETGKFASLALEIDSRSNQHWRFYNSFVDFGKERWMFVKDTRPLKRAHGNFFTLDDRGQFQKVPGCPPNLDLAQRLMRNQEDCPPNVMVASSWQQVINRCDPPRAFFRDLQILCKDCNCAKARPSAEDDASIIRFLEHFHRTFQEHKEQKGVPAKDEQAKWFAEHRLGSFHFHRCSEISLKELS